MVLEAGYPSENTSLSVQVLPGTYYRLHHHRVLEFDPVKPSQLLALRQRRLGISLDRHNMLGAFRLVPLHLAALVVVHLHLEYRVQTF